jgi:hypothetical protein
LWSVLNTFSFLEFALPFRTAVMCRYIEKKVTESDRCDVTSRVSSHNVIVNNSCHDLYQRVNLYGR